MEEVPKTEKLPETEEVPKTEKLPETEEVPKTTEQILAKKTKTWKIYGLILTVLLVFAIFTQGFSFSGITGRTTLSADSAAEKAIDYINGNLMTTGQATLKSIEEENNVYKIEIEFQEQVVTSHVSKDGKLLFPNAIPLDGPMIQQEGTEQDTPNMPENEDIKSFYDSGKEICYEDGKPIIRMYSRSSCGYCSWNKPIFEKVVNEYVEQEKIVAYLWEDNEKDLLNNIEMPQEESDLFYEYSTGGVPAFVFGCKYYRVGAPYSRQENGEQLEEQELRTVIDDLLAQ